MDDDNKFATRTHSQERKWLTNLGKGNLLEGVRVLIQRTRGNQRGGKTNKTKE